MKATGLSYIVIREVQRGLYQACFRGSSRSVLDINGSPMRSFTSRKEARAYIADNWDNLRFWN